MADNYLQYSAQITDLTIEERKWLQSKIDLIDAHESEDEREDDFNVDSDENYGSLVLEKNDLWLYSDEFGDPAAVADFVQAFLKKFRPDACFTFEWACTCSKPRLEEFGGGAVFITADSTEWLTTGEWVIERGKEYLDRQK